MSMVEDEVVTEAAPGTPPGGEAIRVRPAKRRQVGFWIAVGWLALVVLAAVFADLLPLAPATGRVRGLPVRTAPGFRFPEFLGTDATGRSILSRLIYGGRQSLLIGVASIGLAVAIGGLLGLVAGYFGRAVDAVVSVVVDALLAFPPLVLLLAIASIGGRNKTALIIGLTIVYVAYFARLVRANTISIRNRTFIDAARVMGSTHRRIIFREILPNVVPAVVSIVFLFMATVIIAEGSLSFLGLGIPAPSPSWGGMVNEGRQWLQKSPHLVIIPSACLVFTVIASRRIGEFIRVRLGEGERRS